MRSEDVDVIGEKRKLQSNREYIAYFVNNEVMERSYFSRSFSQYICTYHGFLFSHIRRLSSKEIWYVLVSSIFVFSCFRVMHLIDTASSSYCIITMKKLPSHENIFSFNWLPKVFNSVKMVTQIF